jgi:hypothetical protein
VLGAGAKAILAARELGTVQSSGSIAQIAQPSLLHFAFAQAALRIP